MNKLETIGKAFVSYPSCNPFVAMNCSVILNELPTEESSRCSTVDENNLDCLDLVPSV